jgi:rhamnulose-1-phosphate aldolase
MNDRSYPDLDSLLVEIGDVGRRLSEINASEGGAGNISVCIRGPLEFRRRFPDRQDIALPLAVPGLAGATFLVTGSGRRLREVFDDPEGNLGCLIVDAGGETGRLHTSPQRRFVRLTSEFNSHLAVHDERLASSDVVLHAVVHAQPPHLTYLSHIAAYQNEGYLNRRLFRWQPETILQMPEGLGVLPFLVPGSGVLATATCEAMRRHQLAIWIKHGVVARADGSVRHAADLVEYAEAAARYEYLNLAAGEPAQGLSADEVRAICRAANIQQGIF